MKRSIFLLLSFVFVALGLSAQSLVFHLANGDSVSVSLSSAFTITPNTDTIVIKSNGPTVELARGNVTLVTFSGIKGDVNDDMVVDVADIANIISIMAGGSVKVYTSCPDDHHPHIIDLGLPSGTKWACCNVGAGSPEDYGDYYAWGETKTKSVYSWDTYQYGYYNDDEDYSHLVNIGSDIAGTIYDAATVNWGTPWRMPSQAQFQELLNSCSSTWTTQNGVNGRKFTGSNGGTIFLPAAGYCSDSNLNWAGSDGLYWSSALNESDPCYACDLGFNSGYAYWYDKSIRCASFSVRPVR